MLCGPSGCSAAAACVLCCNSLPSTECASCGLGLLALRVCAQRRCWIWESQGDCGVVSEGPAQLRPCQDKLKPSLALLPLGLLGAVWLLVGHKAWRRRSAQVGHRQRISPQTSLILQNPVPCVLLSSVLLP